MEEYVEENGISFGEFFRLIFKRWKLLLIITLSFIIVGTLGIQLIYNRAKTEYAFSFQIDLPITEKEKEVSMKYPDGTMFRYQDLVSLTNLKAVKESNADFSNIDVETIYEKEAISLTKELQQVKSGDLIYAETVYTVTAKAKYFENNKKATAFLTAVAESPIRYSKSSVENANYFSYKNSFNSTTAYDRKVSVLESQYLDMYTQYAKMVELYGLSYPVGEKTLSAYMEGLNSVSELNTIGGENANGTIIKVKSALTKKLESGGFVAGEQATESALAETYSLLNDCERKLAEIKDVASGNTGIDIDKFAEYVEEKVALENKLKALALSVNKDEISNFSIYENKLKSIDSSFNYDVEQTKYKKEVEAFENQINMIADNLEKVTNDFKTAKISLIEKESNITLMTVKAKEQGGISLPLAIILTLLVGAIVSAIVILIMDLPKYKKQKAEALKTENKEQHSEK